MSELCIACNSPVKDRRHAVTCDVCERWQHRLCGTGITRDQDFAALWKEVELMFVYQPCVLRIPPRDDDGVEVGDEATETFLEEAVTAEADASTAISEIPNFTTSQFLKSVAHLYGPKDS